MSASDAGWKPDPSGRHQHRYFDGTSWTDQVSDNGTLGTDPMDAAAAPEPPASTGPAAFAAPSAPPPGSTGATGGGKKDPTPFIIGGVLLVILVGVGIYFATRGDDGPDSDVLAAELQEQGYDEEQSACLADAIGGNFSNDRIEELQDGSPLTAEENQAILTAASDCGIVGVDPGDVASEEGMSYGDNPTLDALWDACEDGDGRACDDLYLSSAVGSEYERFGDTCGDRFPPGEVLCAMEDLD